MNSRRKLLAALGAGVLAVPLGVFAQPNARVWRVGFLATSRLEMVDTDRFYGAFRQGMRELGYSEGRNLVIEWRSAEGRADRLPGLAAELVALRVDAIVAVGTTAVAAAQKASATIPIVMATAADPVGSGFVTSLAQPRGNITGLSNVGADLGPKQLELLRGLVPKLSVVSLLLNPTSPLSETLLKNVQAAAQRNGLKLLPLEARTPEDIERAFSAMAQQGAGAVIVPGNVLFGQQWRQIVELTKRHRLPSAFQESDMVEGGGLMSYGPNRRADMRRAATYLDKIFKGAKPGDLPVEEPTKLELIINGKTAKSLGLTIPQSLLIRAEKVIE